MCTTACLMFGSSHLFPEDVRGKRVIEVGSYDMNGSMRPTALAWKPAEYVGVDIVPGPGVDVICDADDVIKKFGKERFDVVISTESIEHTRNWRTVISNLKNLAAPGGVILVTTCMPGHYYHPHPGDFWRYTPEDFKEIFGDLEIKAIASDARTLGVYLRAVKPKNFREKDLSSFKLTSIVTGTRIADIDDATLTAFTKRYEHRKKLRAILGRFEKFFASAARRILPGV
ncbi:MAG: methyltransferase domain-containing protein [Patescibacteria group bacterium]